MHALHYVMSTNSDTKEVASAMRMKHHLQVKCVRACVQHNNFLFIKIEMCTYDAPYMHV